MAFMGAFVSAVTAEINVRARLRLNSGVYVPTQITLMDPIVKHIPSPPELEEIPEQAESCSRPLTQTTINASQTKRN